MDITKINEMCNNITDNRNQITNNVAHTCGACYHFSATDGGICFKCQAGVRAWDKCEICNGKHFTQCIFE